MPKSKAVPFIIVLLQKCALGSRENSTLCEVKGFVALAKIKAYKIVWYRPISTS